MRELPDPEAVATGELVDRYLFSQRKARWTDRKLQYEASLLGEAARDGWTVSDRRHHRVVTRFASWIRENR